MAAHNLKILLKNSRKFQRIQRIFERFPKNYWNKKKFQVIQWSSYRKNPKIEEGFPKWTTPDCRQYVNENPVAKSWEKGSVKVPQLFINEANKAMLEPAKVVPDIFNDINLVSVNIWWKSYTINQRIWYLVRETSPLHVSKLSWYDRLP